MVRRRQRRGKVPNEAIEVSIAGMSHEGRGIGHINGKVAFVEGALPGELVKAQYQRNRSHSDRSYQASGRAGEPSVRVRPYVRRVFVAALEK